MVVIGRPKKKILLPYETGIKKIKKYKINFDSNKDINKLIKILIKIKPDYIVDFASVCHVDESWKYPEKYFKSNVSSKIKIFNKQFTFLKKLVYVSTPEVFGNQKINLKFLKQSIIPKIFISAKEKFHLGENSILNNQILWKIQLISFIECQLGMRLD